MSQDKHDEGFCMIGKLYAIADKTMFDSIKADMGGHKPGIYRLHITDSAGKFRQIQRVLGVDNNGIIYIGTGQSVANRVGSLRKSVMACYGEIYSDPGTHQVGKRLRATSCLTGEFLLEQFWVSVEEYLIKADADGNDPWGHYGLEAETLRVYREKFGEHPPLNT